MKDLNPYYAILMILLIFLFLWIFYGGKKCEFIGLKPLFPNYVTDHSTSMLEVTPIKEDIKQNVNNNIFEKIPDNLTDTSYDIDLTPEVPEEFIYNLKCTKNDNKFESKPEALCRQVLEKIYDTKFPNTRPEWLRNPETNRCLELDCYNENLKLALEYNGKQHYKWCSFAKQTYNDFKNQVKRDVLKRNICKEKGIHLITVPYNISYSMIPLYIVYNLPELIRSRILEENIIEEFNK